MFDIVIVVTVISSVDLSDRLIMTYSVLPYSIQEKNSMHRHAHAFQKKWFPFQSLLSSPAIGLVPLFCVESTVGGSSRYRSTVFPCSRQVGGKRDKRKSRRFFSISSKNARSPDGTTSSSIYQRYIHYVTGSQPHCPFQF
jgi:hypothetical protein